MAGDPWDRRHLAGTAYARRTSAIRRERRAPPGRLLAERPAGLAHAVARGAGAGF